MRFGARQLLFRMSGVDLTQIEGISETTALVIPSELGTDLSDCYVFTSAPQTSTGDLRFFMWTGVATVLGFVTGMVLLVVFFCANWFR